MGSVCKTFSGTLLERTFSEIWCQKHSKWEAFGWHVQEINGHDFEQIENAFNNAKLIEDKPSVIVAHTIKGKGVSFMEDDNNWHYKIPNQEELKMALEELGI